MILLKKDYLPHKHSKSAADVEFTDFNIIIVKLSSYMVKRESQTNKDRKQIDCKENCSTLATAAMAPCGCLPTNKFVLHV
jgi:hypothetical protein